LRTAFNIANMIT